jgi:hypothetical protein
MASADYYRRQAQLFSRLALATSDKSLAERYNLLVMDYLSKAEELEPSADFQVDFGATALNPGGAT